MTRQSISLSEPNDTWLKLQLESKEYSSKSELINELIRKARKEHEEISFIREKLNRAEIGGFTNDSKEEILHSAKRL
jgi:antitoxin ParD1/3/4